MIDDSHMCGCASELGKNLGPEYEVTATIMPGLGLQKITQLARNEIAALSHRDVVTIWGVQMILIEIKQ